MKWKRPIRWRVIITRPIYYNNKILFDVGRIISNCFLKKACDGLWVRHLRDEGDVIFVNLPIVNFNILEKVIV